MYVFQESKKINHSMHDRYGIKCVYIMILLVMLSTKGNLVARKFSRIGNNEKEVNSFNPLLRFALNAYYICN